MVKYKNLHDKIKQTRETLGLKQKDFIVKISEMTGHGDKPMTPGLVSQWESGRTTPKPKQIAAIANLTIAPWWSMLWFMHDDLPADRGVDYRPDGSFTLAPDFSEAELDEMHKELRKLENEPVLPHLIEWMEKPETLIDLRLTMAKNDHLYKAGNANVHTALLTEDVKASDVSVALTGVSANSFGGPLTWMADQAADNVNALIARRSPCVGDLLAFKEKQAPTSPEGQRARGTGMQDRATDFVSRHEKFQGVMQYFLEEDCQISDVDHATNKIISTGAIKVRVSFHLHGVSVQIIMLHESMPLGVMGMRLKDKLAELVLVDRMQNRAAKKMIMFCSYEKDIDMEPLRERFDQHVQSAALLGVSVEFASGPNGAAFKIAELIASFKEAT